MNRSARVAIASALLPGSDVVSPSGNPVAVARVLLAHECFLLAEGVRHALESCPGCQVVAQVSNGDEALRETEWLRPELALIDGSLPPYSGVALVREIRARSPETRCLVMSTRSRERRVEEFLYAGASGFLSVDASPFVLRAAVGAVRNGRRYFSRTANGGAEKAMEPGWPAHGTVLTDRERQVLQLISKGLSNREIASELGISRKTVDGHRTRLMDKLDLHKTANLVRYAIREGLVAL